MGVRTWGKILDTEVRVFVLFGRSAQKSFFPYIILEVWFGAFVISIR